jgi:hypothetical protein
MLVSTTRSPAGCPAAAAATAERPGASSKSIDGTNAKHPGMERSKVSSGKSCVSHTS